MFYVVLHYFILFFFAGDVRMTRSGGTAAAPRPLNTVQFEHPSHTGALLYGLNTLRSKGLLLDVTLIAGGEAFQVVASLSLSLSLSLPPSLSLSLSLMFSLLPVD